MLSKSLIEVKYEKAKIVVCNHDIYNLSWIQNVTRCNAPLVSFGNCTGVYEAPRRDLGLTDKTTQKSKLLDFRLEVLKILCLNLCVWHFYPDKGYIWAINPSIQPCIQNNQFYDCFGKMYLSLCHIWSYLISFKPKVSAAQVQSKTLWF